MSLFSANRCDRQSCDRRFIPIKIAENYGTCMKLSVSVEVYLGRFVQSVVSLTSSLVVKMLSVLVGKICNSHVFLLKKCE